MKSVSPSGLAASQIGPHAWSFPQVSGSVLFKRFARRIYHSHPGIRPHVNVNRPCARNRRHSDRRGRRAVVRAVPIALYVDGRNALRRNVDDGYGVAVGVRDVKGRAVRRYDEAEGAEGVVQVYAVVGRCGAGESIIWMSVLESTAYTVLPSGLTASPKRLDATGGDAEPDTSFVTVFTIVTVSPRSVRYAKGVAPSVKRRRESLQV